MKYIVSALLLLSLTGCIENGDDLTNKSTTKTICLGAETLQPVKCYESTR